MHIFELLTPEFLIRTFGLLGIFFIVFAESGLFFGFFLPGDSLLLTAGLFAAKGELDLAILIFLCTAGAILGDTVGYWFGQKTGSRIFRQEDSRFFKRERLEKARQFYDRHGGKTIVLARFMPFVRTFAPIVAGAAKMNYLTFLGYNLIGGIIWGAGLPIVGYTLGRSIPADKLDKYFLFIIGGIILVSVLFPLLHALSSLHPDRKS